MNTINMESSVFGAKTDAVSAVEDRKVKPQPSSPYKAETLDQMEALVNLVKITQQSVSSRDQNIHLIKKQVDAHQYILDINTLVEHLHQEFSIEGAVHE